MGGPNPQRDTISKTPEWGKFAFLNEMSPEEHFEVFLFRARIEGPALSALKPQL